MGTASGAWRNNNQPVLTHDLGYLRRVGRTAGEQGGYVTEVLRADGSRRQNRKGTRRLRPIVDKVVDRAARNKAVVARLEFDAPAIYGKGEYPLQTVGGFVHVFVVVRGRDACAGQ